MACAALLCAPVSSVAVEPTHLADRSYYQAPHAAIAPSVDGIGNEAGWQQAEWRAIEHRWLGPEFTADDFRGRFKVMWTEDSLYLLVEIVDDILFDSHRHPLLQYWDDDCLEVFVDEDHSGGDHQYNHNAFAYHMSLDNQAIDIGTDAQPHNYSHHVASMWRADGDKITWELAIDVYGDDYDDAGENSKIPLTAGKILGLMLAYCDNDGSELRENFIGSEAVPHGPKDRGWIDAGLFGTLELSKAN